MINANPKEQVENIFHELFGFDHDLEVRGRRICPRGLYLTEICVDGDVIASTSHQDWRKSYNLLKVAVEKLYVDGLALV